ncbi:MAG: hypothetical protein HQ557_01495 [Bacteroidetes bacterium]|nr:hypothetical protein [Bacteroidota bacterium]
MTEENKTYKVITEYISPYPVSIIFHKGEIVHIGTEFADDPEWGNWIRCVVSGDDRSEKEAWCPRQYLEILEDKGVFIQNYDAKELTVHIGEILSVGEQLNGFGVAVKGDGDCGWVPMKCLVELL